MPAPVNIPLENLTEPPEDWPQQERAWLELNRQIGGHPDFHALIVKAAYVIGIIHQHCECVTYLLRAPDLTVANRTHPWVFPHQSSRPWQTTYMPAYALFASGIDLLGRCLRGNSKASDSAKDIEAGFRWLKEPWYDPKDTRADAEVPNSAYGYSHVSRDDVLVSTTHHKYTISQLAALRHYAAHGQATSQHQFPEYHEVLEKMPALLGFALDVWWNRLQEWPDPCNRLARANLLPFRGLPILTSWVVFERGTDDNLHSLTSIFDEFDWRVT